MTVALCCKTRSGISDGSALPCDEWRQVSEWTRTTFHLPLFPCCQLCTVCEKSQQWRFVWRQVIITTAPRQHHMGVPGGIRMFSTAGGNHAYPYRHLAKHRGLFGRGSRLSIWADCRLSGGSCMDLIMIAGVVEPAVLTL